MLGVLAEFIKFLGIEEKNNNRLRNSIKKEDETIKEEVIEYENQLPKYFTEIEEITLGSQKIQITKDIEIKPTGKGKSIKKTKITNEKVLKF
ncbi:hypothetical protein H2274_07050 [Campylobacter sp. W0049]|uniref:hypothetical protein n=1 Tax=Campylobacter molothri TaxID=1032242 RepID=UPI00301DF425|nr:hypothetical protein [Campylobacter sp. W0049]